MALAQLAVFVRPPESGEVKTRLSGVLGKDGAAALYRAFVDDTLRLGRRVRSLGRIDLALWSTSLESDEVTEWAGRLGTAARLQPEGDLGVRLHRALDDGLRDYERVVVIGSDSPTLPVELVVAAFDSLANAPMMLGPASDGGYYAVGAAQGIRPTFDRVRWSTPHALEDTLRANAARPPAIIPPWYDIDEPEDLDVLRAHLSVDSEAAPSTARCLSSFRAAQR